MNILQLEFDVPPLTPSIVDPVHELINDCPAGVLFFTVVPKFEITTVGPPGPVAPVAFDQSVS